MHHDDESPGPACPCCRLQLLAHELTWKGCGVCARRTGELLGELPGERGLYARLSSSLIPGQGGAGGRVSGTKHAPLPLRLDPLSLSARGGVIDVLHDWLTAWHDQLGFNPPQLRGNLQQQCDDTVRALRSNLPWATENFDPFPTFAHEVQQQVAACRRAVTGEKPERAISVVCGCGALLRITLNTPSRRCHGCETQYGWTELRHLPAAERSAA